jgi:energy-converting hydrogenase A subunit M
MTTRKKTTAIALTGAVALASGAYALGSQAGDGTATAGDSDSPAAPEVHMKWRGSPLGLDDLADRLGVEESELRDALEEARPQAPRIRDDFAEQLADELGIDKERVEAALDRMRDRAEQEFDQRFDELAQRLADRLNLDVDEVNEALDGFPFFEHRRPAPPPTP